MLRGCVLAVRRQLLVTARCVGLAHATVSHCTLLLRLVHTGYIWVQNAEVPEVAAQSDDSNLEVTSSCRPPDIVPGAHVCARACVRACMCRSICD